MSALRASWHLLAGVAGGAAKRQRLALACARLRRPSLPSPDEATRTLDAGP